MAIPQPKLPSSGGISHLPNFPGHLGFIQGNVWHVRPKNGLDTNDGKSTRNAFKTLAKAQLAATANQNDVVLLYSESNTAADTTDYQTATLAWSKDGVHLIGVCAGGPYNKRARIAWKSDAASGSDIPLVLVDADNCYIANLSLSVGSADANLSFGLKVTGDNNFFENVDVAFPTNDANDVAGAYALKLDGADQCRFRHCTFGSFTIDLGTAVNQILLIDTGISGTFFEDCDFISRIQHNTNSPAVRLADAGSVGFGCVWFKRCNFIFTSVSGANTQTGAFVTAAAQTDGRIVLADCHTNATKWDAEDRDMILNASGPTPIGDTSGITLAV